MPRTDRYFQLLGYLFLGVFLFAYLVLPSQVAQGFLASRGAGPAGSPALVMLASGLAALLFHLLARTFGVAPIASLPRTERKSRTIGAIPLLASLLILGHCVSHLGTPLDEDEKNIGSALAESSFASFAWSSVSGDYPDSGRDQLLSNFASALALRVFGVDELSLRIPAVLFAVLFLIGLFLLTSLFSATAMLLVYGHCLANQELLWYLHSSRGYGSLLAFLLLALWMIVGALEGRKRSPILVAVIFLGLAFSHTFGAISVGLLLLAATIHSRRHGSHEAMRVILITGLFILPLCVPALLGHAKALGRQGFLLDFVSVWGYEPPIGGALGLRGVLASKLAILVVAVAAIAFYRSKTKDPRLELLWIFLAVAAGFFIVVAVVAGVRYWPPRLALAFAPVLVIAATETARARNAWGIVTAGLFFVALPLTFGASVYRHRLVEFGPDGDFHEFIAQVRRDTGPLASDCYELRGSAAQQRWARQLYLATPPSGPCPTRYQVDFDSRRIMLLTPTTKPIAPSPAHD